MPDPILTERHFLLISQRIVSFPSALCSSATLLSASLVKIYLASLLSRRILHGDVWKLVWKLLRNWFRLRISIREHHQFLWHGSQHSVRTIPPFSNTNTNAKSSSVTCSACIVLTVVLKSPLLRNTLPEEHILSIEDSWFQCNDILEVYQQQGVSIAGKCMGALRRLHDDGMPQRGDQAGKYSRVTSLAPSST